MTGRLNGDWQTVLDRGILLQQQGDLSAASAAFKKVLALNPQSAQAHFQLAEIAHKTLAFREELRHLQACFALSPLDYAHLGQRQLAIMEYIGLREEIPDFCAFALRASEAGKAWFARLTPDKQVALRKDDIYIHTRLLAYLYSRYQISDNILFEQLRHWAKVHTEYGGAIKPFPTFPQCPQPLKIAYLSQEFDRHSPIQIIRPLIENHDRLRFEWHALSDLQYADQVTAGLKSFFHFWHDTREFSNQALFTYIRKLGIHILVDLGGLTHCRRLPVFGMRAAPVQMTGLGYLCSTGMETMDGIFVDPYICPAERKAQYLETPYYLSSLFHWQPPEPYPIEPLPFLERGYITFGSANSLNKVCPAVLDTWADILKRVSDAHLCLKTPALDDLETQNALKTAFEQRGVDPQRLIFWGRKPEENHLCFFYGQIDIALDTFPYVGAITTCDALWMGVPVIVLYETDISSRAISSSILQQISRQAWIAPHRESYVQRAIALAQNPLELVTQRQRLRQDLLDSVICDGPRFAREVEAVYQTAWEQGWAHMEPASQSLF